MESAGIAGIYSREVQFNHVDWIMDVNLICIVCYETGDIGTLGAFVSFYRWRKMPVRTNEQLKEPESI
jgi:hypothetical protein